MASNRDPKKSYRTNRRGRKVTTSATRSKRVKASTAPKPTSSTTRANRRGSGVKKVTSDSSRSSSGKAKVTGGKVTTPKKSFTMGGDTGRRGGGPNQPAKPSSKVPTQGRPKAPGRFKFKIGSGGTPVKGGGGMKTGSNNLRARGTAALAGAIATGSLRNPISKAKTKAAQEKAKQSVGKYNTRDSDGTVRNRKKVGPAKVGPKKVGPKKVGTEAQSFDKAFSAARKSGKKVFTWKGKKYNTKVK